MKQAIQKILIDLELTPEEVTPDLDLDLYILDIFTAVQHTDIAIH
jgi:hypothetical protein